MKLAFYMYITHKRELFLSESGQQANKKVGQVRPL